MTPTDLLASELLASARCAAVRRPSVTVRPHGCGSLVLVATPNGTMTLGADAYAGAVAAARSWALDCAWIEDDDALDALSDLEILRGAERHYAGGLCQLVRDALVPTVEVRTR